MKDAFVVDASVSAAWFLPDEATSYTEAALEATVQAEVWVPSLWQLEITNLLSSAFKRKRISAAKRRELIVEAADLRVRVDREAIAMPALELLAAQHGLSAYDAVYLELSIRKGLPLVTLDEALRKAAIGAGLEVLGTNEGL